MRILRVHTPGSRPEDTGVCRAAFRYLADTMPFPFSERETLREYGYRDVLREFWHENAPLCILEQDLIPTPGMLRDLADCPYELCAQAYWLGPKSLGRDGFEIAHRVYVKGEELPQWIKPGVEWSDLAGFGLTKLGKYARRKIAPDWQSELYHHTNMDTKLSMLFHEQGMRFHIHYPSVAHFHQ